MNHRHPHHTTKPVTHTASTLLGTAVLMPRTPRHTRAIAECLMLRVPTGYIT